MECSIKNINKNYKYFKVVYKFPNNSNLEVDLYIQNLVKIYELKHWLKTILLLFSGHTLVGANFSTNGVIAFCTCGCKPRICVCDPG